MGETLKIINQQVYMLPTTKTADLAAIVKTSAQETTSGQTFSTAFFAASTTSKPPRLKFGCAVFSVCFPSSKTDASHPLNEKANH